MKPVRIKLLFAPIRSSRGKHLFPLLLMCVLLLLTSCGMDQESEEEGEERGLIYAAINPVLKDLEKMIQRFNNQHPDTPIVIHDYSDENGVERLKTELAMGKIPDIIEMQRLGYVSTPAYSNKDPFWNSSSQFQVDTSKMFWMPYHQMAIRGYLEDLWPYIENDPEFGRERVLEAPLKAAEVNGGLYMLPKYVSISTLVGPQSVVGDRCGWTLEELLEAFSTMPEGSTVLEYEITRWDVFSVMLAPSLDQFINWETGECSFDSQGFQDMLGFLSLFPDEVNTWISFQTDAG